MAQNVRYFPGGYRVLKLAEKNLGVRMDGMGVATPPHPTIVTAVQEAKMLNAHHPESTFLVIREMARVKTTNRDGGEA